MLINLIQATLSWDSSRCTICHQLRQLKGAGEPSSVMAHSFPRWLTHMHTEFVYLTLKL